MTIQFINLKLFSRFYISPYTQYVPILKSISVDDSRYVGLIYDYIPGGTVRFRLNKLKTIPLEDAKFYTANIVRLFQVMHSHNVIYRDLRPETVLINHKGYLMLMDFTLAKVLQSNDNYYTKTLCGIPNYLAPEMILSKPYNKSVDWWALGIFLYEILVGYDPFRANDPLLVYQNIINNKYSFPKIIDKDAKGLIKHLLHPDVKKRYGCLKGGVNDIMDHRLFNDFKWDKFDNEKMEPPFVPGNAAMNKINNYFTQEQIEEMKKEQEKEIKKVKVNNNDKEKDKSKDNTTIQGQTGQQPRLGGKRGLVDPLEIDPKAEDIEQDDDPFLAWL